MLILLTFRFWLIVVTGFASSLAGLQIAGACAFEDGLDLPLGASSSKIEKVLAGRYLRHSPHYYRWYLKYRLGKDSPDALPMDVVDRASAMMRLGDSRDALKMLDVHLAQNPTRYSWRVEKANILLISGNRARAGSSFTRAFEVNPNGEFSQDGFASQLLDYMSMQAARDRKKMPMVTASERGRAYPKLGFAHFFKSRGASTGVYPEDTWSEKGRIQALEGLVGLVLCGYQRVPQIYEAMGDLIREGPLPGGGDHRSLAAMAYLKASYLVGDSIWSRLEYRRLARETLRVRTNRNLKGSEKRLSRSMKLGQSLYRQVSQAEKGWANKRLDLERLYDKRFSQR